MIMADQDCDGSHIKGLLINFVHHFWPSLLKVPGFLVEFITPIVKCKHGNKSETFFTLPEYKQWQESISNSAAWTIKYYKGLGTSTNTEAKEYFSAIAQHRIPFTYKDEDDDKGIELAFSKKKVDDRKEWLRHFVPGTYLDHKENVNGIRYHDFIHKELILFSMADNVRSIPSVVDGFKPGQRKILFSCLKRNLKLEIKVAQLAGYISEHSAYHHGEISLTGTIINMAQDYVGSNNLNLLLPQGQFGTRLKGGKDAASARYIFTTLSPLTRLLFHQSDDNMLNFLEDDGQSVEPEFYIPIIPLVLVNGSEGIGTGWSTSVPTYNPIDIVNSLKCLIAGQAQTPMKPWFRGFTGEVLSKGKSGFVVRGILVQVDAATLLISELPVGTWTSDYKEFLELLLNGDGEKNPPKIKDFKEHHTDTTVSFTVTLTEEQMQAANTVGLDKMFKMETNVTTSNMVLFDMAGHIKKYETAEAIMDDFYALRVTTYQKRKTWLCEKIFEEFERLENKCRFIECVINDSLKIKNRKKDDLMKDLKEKGFKVYRKSIKAVKATEELDDEDVEQSSMASDYDYLLSMPIWNMTAEKVEKLKAERNMRELELSTLMGKSSTGNLSVQLMFQRICP